MDKFGIIQEEIWPWGLGTGNDKRITRNDLGSNKKRSGTIIEF